MQINQTTRIICSQQTDKPLHLCKGLVTEQMCFDCTELDSQGWIVENLNTLHTYSAPYEFTKSLVITLTPSARKDFQNAY